MAAMLVFCLREIDDGIEQREALAIFIWFRLFARQTTITNVEDKKFAKSLLTQVHG
jgi:hypothetical protein